MPSTSRPNGRGKRAVNPQKSRSGYQRVQNDDRDLDHDQDRDESADGEESLEPLEPFGLGHIDEEDQTLNDFTRRKRSPLVYGLACLITLIIVSATALNLILYLSRSTYAITPTPDVLSPFCQPDKLPKPGEQALPYPSDLLRDVTPIPIHSHNDYWRKVPLCTALYYGAIGVEADLWLQPGGELLVGHNSRALRADRSFRSLYIDPLVAILTAANADSGIQNVTEGEPHGVFDTNPGQTLTLLIDVKTDGASTFRRVLEQLEPLRARGWLSTFEKGRSPEVQYGVVTVVGTGNTPFEAVIANETHRDVFFDAPLHRLGEAAAGGVEYNGSNSYWASASIQEALEDDLDAVARGKTEKMKSQVKEAHRRGMDVRYWDLPGWPIGWRDKLWGVLLREGVDILNVDDLQAAAKSDWSKMSWG